eukprot:NODE_3597_length_765_cov_299.381690.p1 GENE.NODE_3597_length_765_cov_299.381690~~NODE_3597_length_765_cov_299.381690.p1  ORF type:complete len:175 (+),score=42.90 NODE_3597_length_765_cov_299.381690:3-527(+)
MGNSSQLKKYLPSLKTVVLALPQVEFVLAVTKETRALSIQLMDEPQPNLAFFFDAEDAAAGASVETPSSPSGGSGGSGGSGASTPPRRPPPCLHLGIHCGYGGFLTIDNLTDELRRIAEVVNNRRRPVWVDVESGLRTTGPGRADEFDLGKAWACIRTVFDLGLPWPRPTFASR